MKQALLVVGMHRSGTSALAGALSILGVDLGTDLLPARSGENELGFFELKEVVSFHEDLLLAGGRTWDLPAPLTASWLDRFATRSLKTELARILESNFADSDLWAVKDPRLCQLLPFWQKVLADLSVEVAVVHIVRDPDAVAASLARRNGFSTEKSGYLWLDHNLSAERDSRGWRRVCLAYRDLLDGKMTTLNRLAGKLDLSWPQVNDSTARAVEKFLTDDLDHRKDPFPGEAGEYGQWTRIVAKLAKLLRELSKGGNGGATLDAFDKLRAKQEALLSRRDPILLTHCADLVLGSRGLRELHDAVNAAEEDLESAAVYSKKIERTLETARKGQRQGKKYLASLERELTGQREQVEKVDAHAKKLEADLDKKAGLIRELEGEVHKQADSIAEHERALAQADRYTQDLEQQIDKLEFNQREQVQQSRSLQGEIEEHQKLQEVLTAHIQKLEQEVGDRQKLQGDLNAHIQKLEQELERHPKLQENLTAHIQKLEQELERHPKLQKDLAAHAQSLEREIEKHQDLQKTLTEHIQKLEQELEKHRIQQQELANYAQGLAARLQGR